MGKIIYLGYFSTALHKRDCSPAAVTMMDYVSDAIISCGLELNIISIAQSSNCVSRETVEEQDRKLYFLPSYGNIAKEHLCKRVKQRIIRNKDLYNELISLLEADDILLVYHSMAYVNVLRKLRREKKFKLILQVCELYCDVSGTHRKKELKWISEADSYIFSTLDLEKKLNKGKKAYTICLGTYKVEDDRKCRFIDSKLKPQIHIVYAGTFDPRKGGGKSVAMAAKHLPSVYHIHIIGFGTEEEKQNLITLIDELKETCECTISYDGCLYGEDYIRFLQSCDIGLCVQNVDAAFNGTSFPSKILSYLSNGLQVVSIRIPTIEKSAIAKYLYFYNTQSPEELAKAIMQVDLYAGCDARQGLIVLNQEFCHDLRKILTP